MNNTVYFLSRSKRSWRGPWPRKIARDRTDPYERNLGPGGAQNNILPAAVRSEASPKNLHIFTHLSVRLHVSAACSCEQPAYVPVGIAVLAIGYGSNRSTARPAQDTINTTAAVP